MPRIRLTDLRFLPGPGRTTLELVAEDGRTFEMTLTPYGARDLAIRLLLAAQEQEDAERRRKDSERSLQAAREVRT